MPEMDYKDRLEQIVRSDAWSMTVLETVRSLELPDWATGAGFVRALVWDKLTSQPRTALDDVDVLFFDSSDTSELREKKLEQLLSRKLSAVPWSVKNQARMHIRNRTAPYTGTEDAMKYWLETPTAVAVRLEPDDSLTVLAPYGLVDLFQMIIRPTPKARGKLDQFEARLTDKPWLSIWPDVEVCRTGKH